MPILLKVYTDPDDGTTKCELTAGQRKSIAEASSILKQLRLVFQDTEFGDRCQNCIPLLDSILIDKDLRAPERKKIESTDPLGEK